MCKLFLSYPNRYRIFLFIAYLLPIAIPGWYTIIVLLPQGLQTFIGAFIGCSILSYFILSPFFCIYYSLLTLLHTILDQIILLKFGIKQFVLNLLVSLFISIYTILMSILLIMHFHEDSAIIWASLMAIGIIIIFKFTQKRISILFK